ALAGGAAPSARGHHRTARDSRSARPRPLPRRRGVRGRVRRRRRVVRGEDVVVYRRLQPALRHEPQEQRHGTPADDDRVGGAVAEGRAQPERARLDERAAAARSAIAARGGRRRRGSWCAGAGAAAPAASGVDRRRDHRLDAQLVPRAHARLPGTDVAAPDSVRRERRGHCRGPRGAAFAAARRMTRPMRFAVFAALLGIVAAASPAPDRVTDRDVYEATAARIIVPDCGDLQCFRTLVPWVLGRIGGPSTLRWKAYAVLCNAAGGVAGLTCSLAFGLSRRAAAMASIASAFGFGSLYTLHDPYTSDPLMYLVGPFITHEALAGRAAIGAAAGAVSVMAKEFAGAP